MTRVTQRQLDAYGHFLENGLHEKGAAAPVGNFVQESGENLDSSMFRAHPDASGGVPQDQKSGGIAEWLGSRKALYIKFSRAAEASRNMPGGSLLNDLSTQCDYVIHELQNGDNGNNTQQYAELWHQLTVDTGRSVATLTANFMEMYERPKMGAGTDKLGEVRIPHAEAIYERAQLIKAAEGQPTPIPAQPAPPIITGNVITGTTTWIPQQPQVVINPPIPPPLPPQLSPPAPQAPAGPLISAHIAGRQIAILDNLQEMRASIVAERDAYLVSTAMMLAKVDKSIKDIEDIEPVPATHAIAAPLALPRPSEQLVASPAITTQKRTKTMFGKSWITSVLGVGTIGSAVASIGIDILNKQMPDWSQIMLVIASIGGGSIGLAAKDKAVTGGTVSAVTGATLAQPVSVVDEKIGGRRQDFGR